MKKLEYIDVARGIGILLVVFGHSLTKEISNSNSMIGYLRYFIYTIHMPLFFIISGILFQMNIKKYCKYKKIIYIKDKFMKFIIPYLTFSVINYSILYFGLRINFISTILLNKGYIIGDIKSIVFSILTYIGHIDNHLWFLGVMFIVLSFNRLFIFNINKSIKRTVIITIVFFSIYFVSFQIADYLPEIIWKFMRYNFIFLCGRLLYINGEREIKTDKKSNIIIFIIAIISTIILLCIKNDKHKIYFPFININVELSVAYCIINIICKKNDYNKFLKYIGNGEKTMVIYLLHMPFVLPMIEYILQKAGFTMGLTIINTSIITILIISIVDQLFISKLNTVKKIFFGIYSSKKKKE